jgi:hypothetical protein
MSSEVIRLAKAAREKRNISMFDWLEEAIRFAAKKDLDEK